MPKTHFSLKIRKMGLNCPSTTNRQDELLKERKFREGALGELTGCTLNTPCLSFKICDCILAHNFFLIRRVPGLHVFF